MRSWMLSVAALAVAAPIVAQEHPGHEHHGQHEARAGTGQLPEGWQARLDRAEASLSDVRFEEMDGGYHVTLGPSGIFYRPDQRAEGEYSVQARFTQLAPTPRPESYGVLLGGRDLDGPGQDYLYFLVRQDGRFMVRHRGGDEVHTVQEWTEHPAVARLDGAGSASNLLRIEAGPQRARFLVNGQEVASFEDIPYLNTEGIVGLRINHNLDVHVADFRVEPSR